MADVVLTYTPLFPACPTRTAHVCSPVDVMFPPLPMISTGPNRLDCNTWEPEIGRARRCHILVMLTLATHVPDVWAVTTGSFVPSFGPHGATMTAMLTCDPVGSIPFSHGGMYVRMFSVILSPISTMWPRSKDVAVSFPIWIISVGIAYSRAGCLGVFPPLRRHSLRMSTKSLQTALETLDVDVAGRSDMARTQGILRSQAFRTCDGHGCLLVFYQHRRSWLHPGRSRRETRGLFCRFQ